MNSFVETIDVDVPVEITRAAASATAGSRHPPDNKHS